MSAPHRGESAADRSANYSASGERMNPGAGLYWIPEREFRAVAARAEHQPTVLNRYPWTPIAPAGQTGDAGTTSPPSRAKGAR
jgi:hypothetical protein